MIKTKIVIFIVLVVIVTLAGVGFWYAHKSKNNIDCEGRVVWEINNEEFRGDVAYQMQNNQGIVTITGDLHTPQNKKFKISRIVYFTYYKVRDNYIISTNNLVRFPSDNLEVNKGYRSLPALVMTPTY
ncbi:hypothetical protein U4W25_19905 [Citrobacter amalonaticus]|uniref:hypothetical protein n=1 Tax=Citrobacter TaxID=544 RepID=UPI00049F3C1C|nr:hypothetical protein [Citrobacter sp. MGH 55]ELN9500963.1 hypothetical protein [Citrobacter amalonaticus]ELW9348440.1 hypothetical protein [Citrobacter amalonaticus]KDF09248.1 hypothetical protein AF41_02141 [Citrobacter sp. MGH 55]WQJ83380.1 hypothetical protein U4W25_19905 [Citrobacter amalonaticus]